VGKLKLVFQAGTAGRVKPIIMTGHNATPLNVGKLSIFFAMWST